MQQVVISAQGRKEIGYVCVCLRVDVIVCSTTLLYVFCVPLRAFSPFGNNIKSSLNYPLIRLLCPCLCMFWVDLLVACHVLWDKYFYSLTLKQINAVSIHFRTNPLLFTHIIKHFKITLANLQIYFLYLQVHLNGPSNPYEMSFYNMTNVGRLR